ncbi:MAG: ATP-binding protein [Phycisphaerae bacterium]|nr:ATP-binding protein [Phycisphaerae bacterium]
MKIGQKMILTFGGIALLFGAAGYISIHASQSALQESIGESSLFLVAGILDTIDRTIYSRVEEFQAYTTSLELKKFIKESNEEFEKISDPLSYIVSTDRQWTSVPKETVTDFMLELMSNEPAKELKQRLNFYEEKYGYNVLGEVFITNKYGVNIAQTGKTTDYYQADEDWWQIVRAKGLCVTDIEYDESSDTYSTNIGVRIDDEDGNFLGTIKAVLNIENVIEILQKAKEASPYKTAQFKLFDRNGKVIFADTEKYKQFNYIIEKKINDNIKGGKGYLLKEGEENEGEELFVYASSRGYRDYHALDWTLAIEYSTKEIFAPVAELKNIMLVVPVVIAVALLIGLYVSLNISKPVEKLRDAAVEISKGKLDITIDIDSNNEIGELAGAFNKMSKHLKAMVDNLNQEIVERKKAEEYIENLNKDLKSTVAMLTQSNRQLREFAHLAAHDLKTPLRGISTLAQWLVNDYKEKFDDAGRRQVDLLVERVERMNELVNAILEYSTIGRDRRKEHPVDLNRLVGTVLVETKPPANIKITINKKLPVVVCEETHLRQVFRRLLSNAIRFMDNPEGHITIDYTDKGDLWEFSVSDNGPGIAPQHFERIFQLFQMLNDSDQSKGGGKGLTFVRKVVELYGGQIWLTSEPGQGSTFFFTLPKALEVINEKEQLLTAS